MEQEKKKYDIYFPDFGKAENVRRAIVIAVAVALILLVLFISIRISNKKSKIIEQPFIKTQIDSLAKANAALQAKQAALDSATKTYEVKINNLDWKLNNVGETKTIIREYYRDKVKEPGKYTPKQIDSFFKNRYNY